MNNLPLQTMLAKFHHFTPAHDVIDLGSSASLATGRTHQPTVVAMKFVAANCS
jgi:hypothetical protein